MDLLGIYQPTEELFLTSVNHWSIRLGGGLGLGCVLTSKSVYRVNRCK